MTVLGDDAVAWSEEGETGAVGVSAVPVGFGVQGLGFRVESLGVYGVGFRVYGLVIGV